MTMAAFGGEVALGGIAGDFYGIVGREAGGEFQGGLGGKEGVPDNFPDLLLGIHGDTNHGYNGSFCFYFWARVQLSQIRLVEVIIDLIDGGPIIL